MKYRLFRRYFLGASLIVLISLAIALFLQFITYSNHMSREKHSDLKKACDLVAASIEESDDSYGVAHFVMSNISEVMDCDIYITDQSGKIIVCYCKEWQQNGVCEHTGTVIDTMELNSIVSDNEMLGTLNIYPSPRYLAAVATETGGEISGYIFSTASSESVRILIFDYFKVYLIASIVPIIIMFLAFAIMAYRMNKPLKLMSEAAHAMAKGDFSKRIPVTSDDEIGELAVAFNSMSNSLSRLEETRKSFIANVSHEMRTPMTTIGGFIDGIIDGTIEPEKQKHYLEIVSSEIKRLSRMVQSMLSISRLESSEFVLKKDSFDLREQILNIVIGQEQRIEEKHIEIKGLDCLPSVTVNADKDLIYQAVYNLLDNAIKFVNENGTITFSLNVNVYGTEFCITNTGVGIPRADLPFVFDRFYKLDKSRASNKSSMGLGLYIVKTIIKNHGGTIKVESKENEFTRFSFVLPLER